MSLLARFISWHILSKLMKCSSMKIGSESEFLVLLYDVARHMRTRADQMARKHGTTRAQWVVLSRLERQPGLSQNELAAIAEVAPITIARIVDRLEELGLVERCPDPKDRRIWRLRLTAKAAPHLKEIKRLRAQLWELMTENVDDAQLASTELCLRKMKENLAAGVQPGRSYELSESHA